MAQEDAFGVWPCNWESVSFFLTLSTQWRVGMGGATGLDYTAVITLMREFGWPKDKRQRIFDDVRAMEVEALAVMAEERDKD